jgi:tripartite-type tricarboxylate transporter receptor subunit TctC
VKITRRRSLHFIGAAITAPFLSRFALAQSWPTKPIRAIVPVGAGSTIDVVSRIVFDRLSQQLGQPIISENRAGAGGTIGGAIVARAEPDGHTLLINSSQHSASPAVYPNLSYDTARDFAAVASLGSSPNVVVAVPAKGYKTLRDLVAAAKAKPGGFTYGTPGVGSAVHLNTERFRLSAGFDVLHVPFRGMPEALTEVLAERLDFACSSIAPALPFIRDGKLTALAVSTPQRTPALPDVPTTLEAGYADSDYTFWTGMFLPAKTPREIVERLHGETLAALRASGVAEKLALQGIDPMPIVPAAFDAQIKNEIDSILALVKKAGIKFT